MELVQGVSITEYCNQNSLNTKERLALFLHVCHAVQHAHQKGIIHRDIKPSNVMVTHHDGKPIPKVIDFGIAKAMNQRLTEKTLFTRYAHLIGTPAYMSPEQAELSDLDIDTRSDIYSLGVLLYELLTGTTPFSEEELRKAGFVEMQRVIREQEPVKPSTRIKTALRGIGVPPMLHGRDAHATTSCGDPRLRGGSLPPAGPGARPVGAGPRACPTSGGHGGPPLREVRGDLDWIVMKALEKDRARRYETAGGLAEDVRRHLEHEPILARGPSTGYRLRKFLRRHRWQAIAVLAGVLLAGTAVVVLSLWSRDRLQLAEAEGFRQQAESLRHREILSQAREQYAKAEREAALETIKPILDSNHVGPEARLLQAGIFADNRRTEEAVAVLDGLLNEPPEIAGAAHALLARILWESESLDAEKLKEIEEHRQKAEALLLGGPPSGPLGVPRLRGSDESLPPEGGTPNKGGTPNAEAYFLRAMTAMTIKEQLAALDQALRLENHYESLRLRAFTYYASRKYERMRDDALGMTYLRGRDPLGHSLRALALRELGKHEDAIVEYDLALSLTPKEEPQYVDLSTQRSETFLRTGAYDRVVAEAPECLRSFPDKPVFQYHLFSALTALGEYDKATALFREIIGAGHQARSRFRDWCAKYAFDTLAAGRSWHPADREPAGAAFLPMIEAEETYRGLAAKGRRVTTDGFSASWSPDGKRLTFSLGVLGRSGVAIFDPATKETDLLIVPGKDPKWSPDGKFIAFVRDRQFLRVSEFIAADRQAQQRMLAEEEVWVMRADGTEPRRLARGGWPSWSRDSTTLYYHSRVDNTLCSIAVEDREAQPRRIMPCSNAHPSVSPDNQRVAYLEEASLIIKDLASQAVVAERPASLTMWGGAGWSANGREFCLGGRNDGDDRTGLWVLSLDRTEPAKTLDGQITGGSWAPDGTKLAFCLGPPYFEVWAADLDQNASTTEVLGPGQTLDEHLREMVAFYTRRIEADPQDAYAYSSRARYYDCLHDREKARADMRHWSVALSGRLPVEAPSRTPRRFRGTINGLFGYQLAFSVGGRDNGIPVLCVAFGQKGRCEMRVVEIPMLAMSLIGLGLLSGIDAPPARADFTFGERVNVESVITAIDTTDGNIECFSYDGLEVYTIVLLKNLPGENADWDLCVQRRVSTDAAWGPRQNLGSAVNSPKEDGGASISADGLVLYFGSDRAGGYGSCDIYMTTRASKTDPWGPAANLGPTINSSAAEHFCRISADGLELYFASWRAGGYGDGDIYVARRATVNDPWGKPVNLGPTVNSAYGETYPCLSADSLLLFFCDNWMTSPRPGGYSSQDIWMTRRAGLSAPWQTPVNLGPRLNETTWNYAPRISVDGHTFYYHTASTLDARTWDCWQVPILPIVDLNADGKVDLVDLVMLIEAWGTNNAHYDIGPMPWGDGKVDIEDLEVFMTYYEKENPPAQP
jgi:Tol biopolymer transport system component